MIDTLKLAKRLRAGGFTEDQAEALSESLNEGLRGDIGLRFDDVETTIEQAEERLSARMDKLERRMDSLERRMDKLDTDLQELKRRANLADFQIKLIIGFQILIFGKLLFL